MPLRLAFGKGQKVDHSSALDFSSNFSLHSGCCAGHSAGQNLAGLGDEALQGFRVLVINGNISGIQYSFAVPSAALATTGSASSLIVPIRAAVIALIATVLFFFHSSESILEPLNGCKAN